MRPFIPIRYLLPLTHLSVFVFTAVFIGFSTYSLTKDFFEKKDIPVILPQIGEKLNAEGQQEYLMYEKREVIAFRPNNMNSERVTGYARSLNNEEHIVYSFVDDPFQRKFQKTVPTATLLSNGKIFLNGVSEQGFAILDLLGNNLTADYKILKNRDFPLANTLFRSEKEIFYSFRSINSKEKDSPHKVYWKRESEKLEQFESSTFPNGEFWLQPIGWSSKNDEFYVTRQSDKTTYGRLWKIYPHQKTVQPLQSVSGTLVTNLRVCPQQDYAVFISSPLDPANGHGGELIPPSKLLVSNLSTDTSEIIFYSSALLQNLLLSCQAKKILVKENDAYHLLDINGKPQPRASFVGEPIFFGNDGKTLILKNEKKIYLLNLKNGHRELLGEEKEEDGKIKTRYNILGLISL